MELAHGSKQPWRTCVSEDCSLRDCRGIGGKVSDTWGGIKEGTTGFFSRFRKAPLPIVATTSPAPANPTTPFSQVGEPRRAPLTCAAISQAGRSCNHSGCVFSNHQSLSTHNQLVSLDPHLRICFCHLLDHGWQPAHNILHLVPQALAAARHPASHAPTLAATSMAALSPVHQPPLRCPFTQSMYSANTGETSGPSCSVCGATASPLLTESCPMLRSSAGVLHPIAKCVPSRTQGLEPGPVHPQASWPTRVPQGHQRHLNLVTADSWMLWPTNRCDAALHHAHCVTMGFCTSGRL